MDGFSLMTFWAQYGEFIKLALIFVAIIILLKFKIPLSGAIGIGAVLTVALYGIPVLDSLMIAGKSMISEATIMVLPWNNKTFEKKPVNTPLSAL